MKSAKNAFYKKGAPKLIFFDEFFLERFGWFLALFDELSLDGDSKSGNFIWLQLILGQKPCLCRVPDHEIPLPKLIYSRSGPAVLKGLFPTQSSLDGVQYVIFALLFDKFLWNFKYSYLITLKSNFVLKYIPTYLVTLYISQSMLKSPFFCTKNKIIWKKINTIKVLVSVFFT